MNPFPSRSLHRLSAALGWLGLGDPDSASEELTAMDPEDKRHPWALEAGCRVAAAREAWQDLIELAEGNLRATPDRPAGWMYRARALQGLRKTQEAVDGLRPVALRFDADPEPADQMAELLEELGLSGQAAEWRSEATCRRLTAAAAEVIAKAKAEQSVGFIEEP